MKNLTFTFLLVFSSHLAVAQNRNQVITGRDNPRGTGHNATTNEI